MTPIAILITIAIYVVLLAFVGVWAGRGTDNAGFFIGNRKTKWYMATLAMIGAAMSGVTFLSVPGSVKSDGFTYMQMVLGFTVGQLILAYWIIPLFYNHKVTSLYEYLRNRFGIKTQKTGAWCFFVSKIIGASLKVYIVCEVLQLWIFDPYKLPFVANVSVVMILVWLYTFRGGVKSLIWTDSLKTLCLVASVLLSIIYISDITSVGLKDIVDHPMSKVFDFDSSSPRYFFKMFFAGIAILVAMTGLDQDMMQCNLSCENIKGAQKNVLITAICQAFVIFGLLFLGFLLYRWVEVGNVPLTEKSDQLFASVAVNGGLPIWIGIVFIIGLTSSTYSSAGSALTALTTSFTIDILGGENKYAEARLKTVRLIVHVFMAIGMCCTILLLSMLNSDGVINLLFRIVGYTYGPILGMFLMGEFTKIKIKERYMPLVAFAAPLLSYFLQEATIALWGYHIGFELLIYNALLTMVGMCIIKR